jgi:hypothetical protein
METNELNDTYELASYMGKYDFSSEKFSDETSYECNACGKRLTSGVRILISTFSYNSPLTPKNILIFCNDCWLSPEIEALFNQVKQEK